MISDTSAIDTDLSVNIVPVISLRVTKSGSDIDTLDLSTVPTPEGSFVKDDLSVLVSTSNETGYTLTMADNDADTTMHHTDTTITDTISSISSPAYQSTFPDNSWAYSLEDITTTDQVFDPIPVLSAPDIIKVTSAAASDDATPVTFAAKVDSNLLAGSYVDTIVFSATPNYVPPEQSEFTIAPISTTEVDGGETFTLKTDIDWTDELGSLIVSLYPAHDVSDTVTCANPTAFSYTYDGTNGPTGTSSSTTNMVVGQDYVGITCISPARAAGVYHVKLELFKYNREYIAGNTITYINPSFNVTITKGTGINQISGTNITATSSATATGQNQYGTTVTLNATLATGYNTPTWTVTSGGVTLSSTTGGSVSFTMPKQPATVSVSAKINSYTVTWNGNGGSSPTAYTRTHGQAMGALPTSTRANYTFAGWWNTSAASGGSQVTTATTVTSNVTYWARWTASTIANVSYMQDMTSQICANTAVNATRTLTDRRDNKTYTIKKMSDNKCWMTQNLRLVGARTLTSADSNVTANFALPASSLNFGTTNDAAGINIPRVNDSGNASYGAYYNWYTATAGSGTFAVTSGNVAQSVCPKGWRLPTSAEQNTLYSRYGNPSSFISATSATYSGCKIETGGGGQGTWGGWWSSTASWANASYWIRFEASGVIPQNQNNKRYAYSVRCIAQ